MPDVVVVGSGPAGVSAAWPLVRAGLEVLMLDASRAAPPPAPAFASHAAFRASTQRWATCFGADLAGVAPRADISPKFATPLGRATLDGFAEATGLSSRGFVAAGSLGRGGLSAIWGALAVRLDPAERAGFPAPAQDLDAAYDAVAARIGLERAAAPESRAAAHLLRRHAARQAHDDLRLEPAPNAVLARPREGRESCNRCGLCLHGCHRGSIYASGDELPALRSHPNFRYRPGHLVRAVEAEGTGHRLVVEVEGGRVAITAPTVVLAAGTLASTGLVLDRLGWHDRPVRLLSNPAAATAFLVPRLVGADLPAHAFGLGQLFYRLGLSDDLAAEASAGVLYGAETLPLDLFAARLPVGRPFALRLARALAPALVLATCYLPGSLSRNTIRASRRAGEPRLVIEGEQDPQAVARLRADLARLRTALRRRGALALPGSTSILPPGADAHLAGTLPMREEAGAEPGTTAFGEVAGVAGLYVADGACLPRLCAAHPTLTIMANAERIGGEVARRLLAGERPRASGVAPPARAA